MAEGRLIGGINPRKRFLIMLGVVYILSLPAISALSYVILRDYAIRNAYGAGRLFLTSIEEIRDYVGDVLRPSLYRALPGKFVLEGMSRSFVSGSIARQVQVEYPGYRYKNAILENPKNPLNLADDFEAEIIRLFKGDEELTQWQGIRETEKGQYYVIASKGNPFGASCLLCHGDPARAPEGLIEIYGPEAGFHIKEESLLDAKFVYIPIGLPLAEAKKNVLIFIGLYTLFFGITFLIINARFKRLYAAVDSRQREIEVFNADLTELNQELETMMAERTMSMMALTVADRVRNPAAVIGGTGRRLLEEEKDRVPESVRQTLEDITEKASQLEGIVKDFEALLTARKSVFIREDLNEIIRKVMPVIEREAKIRGLALSVCLSDSRLMMNARKNLLRAAFFHLAKNAMEATPAGGAIAIETKGEDDKVVLSISDTGAGIPAEDIERIFEPFYSTKSRRFGMGLPLVRQVVSEHSGTIEVKSESGAGSTFTLTFPSRWMEKA